MSTSFHGDEYLDELEDEIRRMSEFEKKLLALLDLIECREDPSLARQRFEIAEEFGYTVEFTGEVVSGELN